MLEESSYISQMKTRDLLSARKSFRERESVPITIEREEGEERYTKKSSPLF
jgi:hypothetical protein